MRKTSRADKNWSRSSSGNSLTNINSNSIAHDAALSGGQASASYTVKQNDNLNSIASALATAINNNSAMQTAGITAIANTTDVSPRSTSANVTSYSKSLSAGATETITLGLLYQTNGDQTATIGGTITSGDVVSLTVIDSGLSGGQKSVSHTVQGTDTTTTIATSLKNAINADSSLQAINVSATSSANVVTIVSHSSRITTYAKTVTAAPAPETLALSSMSNVTNFGYNPANQLLTISAPGTARFQGSASKALKSAAVQTQVVSLTPSTVPVPTYSTNVGDTTVIMTLGRDYKNGYRSVVLTGGPYSASAGKDVSIT
ncbi:MAG TPA: hypothetical protein V6D17_07895, partial [Candidatus Obscuribacterales bacterium]